MPNPHDELNAIIHDALRRDLDRLQMVAEQPQPPQRRTAVREHGTWILDVLHHHHVGEDEGVWPRVLAKRPDLQPLVDEMETEHAALASASDTLRSTLFDYGEGRSLAITTDSVWRWGFVAAARPGDDGRHYERFWENATRWLIQDPDLRNLHVDTDAVEYAPGTPVRLAIKLMGRDYQPLPQGKVHLAFERGADPAATEAVGEADVVVGDDGSGSHQLDGLTPGVYRVQASADVDGRKVTATDIFLVREAGTELDRPAGDEGMLQAIAGATGGRHLGTATALPSDLAFDPPRVVRVDRRADVELWSRPGLLVLALLCLGLEWLLRQRSGYL